jgi:hypothetical protein
MTRRSTPALSLAALLLLVPVPHVLALIGDVPTIRAAAVVRSALVDPMSEVVALLGGTPTNTNQLILRTISRGNGALAAPDQVVMIPAGVMPVDVLFSTVFRPGSILVLDDMLRVHEWAVAFDAGGKAKLIDDTATIHGPFGDADVVGAGAALSEAPGAGDPKSGALLGIGTSRGGLMIATGVVDAADYFVDLGKGAITGLATVPQVGGFAFVAAHNGQAVGVSAGGGSPVGTVVFDLADPRPDPFLDLSTGAVFEPNDEPLTSPAPISFMAANGTTDVAVLQIPANPTMGGTLKVGIVVVAGCPIARVDLGSLVMVEADGDAVLYDPGFSLASGPSGIMLTLAGAGVDLDPDVLNLGSRGKFVTARIEVEDGHAVDIDAGTVTLGLSCDAVEALKASINAAPQLGDADEDGQADLTVKFDRAAVEALLSSLREGPTSLAVRWTYRDGSSGCGVTVLHIKKRKA